MGKQVTIRSEKDHQSEQKNRSSDDFSTKGLNGDSLIWNCPEGITFHVWKNQTGKDGKEFEDRALHNNSETYMVQEDKLYISKPNGASEAFNVVVKGNGIVKVGSLNAPAHGQNSRSSNNFILYCKSAKISCPDTVAHFSIKRDISGGHDTNFEGTYRNGDILVLNDAEGQEIYICDPNASEAFTVTFTEI